MTKDGIPGSRVRTHILVIDQIELASKTIKDIKKSTLYTAIMSNH